jgi:zinc-binding alcohol dehydrogenase family protein
MVQLVKQLTKLKVIATASRPETQAWLKELGADQIINHRNPLSEELGEQDNIDYVVSLNNTDEHMGEIVKVIKPQGKFGLIDDPAELDVKLLKLKSISLHWEFMYTRSMFQTEDMIKQHELLSQVAKLIDQGKIKSTLGEHFGQINADNLKQAHAFIESQKAKGKIVLEGF